MIGKVGVEAAKKGVTMAGQKLGEFFTKEGLKQAGQQVGNVGKALYDNRAALASALGDDLTRAGAQVMKAPEAVKAGAQAVGEAASQAAGQVGKEAVRTGIKLGGKAGGQGVKNVGKLATTPLCCTDRSWSCCRTINTSCNGKTSTWSRRKCYTSRSKSRYWNASRCRSKSWRS